LFKYLGTGLGDPQKLPNLFLKNEKKPFKAVRGGVSRHLSLVVYHFEAPSVFWDKDILKTKE
jgi:hypothetical protein